MSQLIKETEFKFALNYEERKELANLLESSPEVKVDQKLSHKAGESSNLIRTYCDQIVGNEFSFYDEFNIIYRYAHKSLSKYDICIKYVSDKGTDSEAKKPGLHIRDEFILSDHKTKSLSSGFITDNDLRYKYAYVKGSANESGNPIVDLFTTKINRRQITLQFKDSIIEVGLDSGYAIDEINKGKLVDYNEVEFEIKEGTLDDLNDLIEFIRSKDELLLSEDKAVDAPKATPAYEALRARLTV